MITIVIGKQGAGKTLYLVKKAIESTNENKEIYANFTLKHINYKKLTPELLLSNELKNCTVLIDEGQAFFDCRRSTSTLNLMLNIFVAQNRKRDVNMYVTTHNLSFIDLRLRFHTTFITIIQPYILINNKPTQIDPTKLLLLKKPPDLITAKTYDYNLKPLLLETFNPHQYFNYYNTNEIIIPNWNEITKKLKPHTKQEQHKTP